MRSLGASQLQEQRFPPNDLDFPALPFNLFPVTDNPNWRWHLSQFPLGYFHSASPWKHQVAAEESVVGFVQTQEICPETETREVIFCFPSTVAQCLCLHGRGESLPQNHPITLDLGCPLEPLSPTPDRVVSCSHPADTLCRLGSPQQPRRRAEGFLQARACWCYPVM